MSKFTRLIGLGLIVILALGFVSGVGAQDDVTRLVVGHNQGVGDLSNLDPSLADGVDAVDVIDEAFVALARMNELEVIPEPGMATWTVSDDGTVYTFDIRDDVPWVRYNADTGEVEQVLDEDGNVRMVTAADFEFGIKRSLDPQLAATYSGILAPWFSGGLEFFQSGDADEATRQELLDNIGVVATGEFTLELTTPNASSVVPSIFSMWGTVAQPSWVIEEFGDFWVEPENINTYGPYAVKEWVHDESITLIANPFWPGQDNIPQPSIDEIVFQFLDPTVQLANFEAGSMDYIDVPAGADVDRVLADPNLSQFYTTSEGVCNYYYAFNDTIPPFDDPRAVRAFSLTIPREAIVENVTKAGEVPAGFFTIPSIVAAPQVEDFPDLAIHTDPELGAQIWQEYLADTGHEASDFNGLTLLFNTSERHSAIAQVIQQAWLENLGVEVQLTNQDFGTYLQVRGEFPVYRAGWCFDYPDTNNFLGDNFHSVFGGTDIPWENADFDALIEQALIETDPAVRAELYAQAERILIWDDATVAPIYWTTSDSMLNDRFVRPGVSRIERDYFEKWTVAS